MVTTLVTLLLAGCTTEEPAEPVPPPTPVEAPAREIDARAAKAAAVARAIDSGTAPAEAMAAEGLDSDAFQALLYEIAEDHDLTVQYERARRKPGGI